jgi:hypothetical protein
MKNRLVTLAGALALMVVLGKFYATPLMAQVRAAIVQDRDSEARNHYQAFLNCSTTTASCENIFPAVPVGKRLIITNVSIGVSAAPASGISLFELLVPGGAIYSIPFTKGFNTFGNPYYSGNATVSAAFEAGQTPTVLVYNTINPNSVGTPYSDAATISGYMIDIL